MKSFYQSHLYCLVLVFLNFADMDRSWAENAAGIPDQDYSLDRYQILWTKSPFAVASNLATPTTSANPAAYKLVGVSRLGGISYASVVDNQGGAGFFLQQNKPLKGLTLLSIQMGKAGSTSKAKILANGQVLALETDNTPQGTLPQPTNPQLGNPGGIRSADFLKPPPFVARRQMITVPSSQIQPASAYHP